MDSFSVSVTKVRGGYKVEVDGSDDMAVASTPRQAARMAAELIEGALAQEETK